MRVIIFVIAITMAALPVRAEVLMKCKYLNENAAFAPGQVLMWKLDVGSFSESIFYRRGIDWREWCGDEDRQEYLKSQNFKDISIKLRLGDNAATCSRNGFWKRNGNWVPYSFVSTVDFIRETYAVEVTVDQNPDDDQSRVWSSDCEIK